MIFAYIKTLDNVHKASHPVVAKSVLERKACCVSEAVAVVIIVMISHLPIGWISTCPGLCVL